MIVKTYSSFDLMPESYRQLFEEGASQGYDFSLPWYRNFARTALDEGDSFSFRFAKPGVYRYLCAIHPRMMATVTVAL